MQQCKQKVEPMGRPKGSKNKPKSAPPINGETPRPDLGGTDRAAGEVSTKEDRWKQIIQQAVLQNNPKNETSRFLKAKKGVETLYNFATERAFIAQARPLVDRINFGFDAADEEGRTLLNIVRNTGTLLLQWKDQVGHGNWAEAYESSGFKKSIDTARNWMRLSLMTDAEIAEVDSVQGALTLLKDKKARKKGKGGKATPPLEPDTKPEPSKPESLESVVGNLMQAAMTPHPDESKPDPESKPEPEFELTLIDELEMVMKRVCAEHPREEVSRMVASMLNDYYQPKGVTS
jgi:hypothetical protein